MLLTGEGGRLKRNVPLVQGRDFVLVPDSLWKALQQWYGGSPALPRQVKMRSFSSVVRREGFIDYLYSKSYLFSFVRKGCFIDYFYSKSYLFFSVLRKEGFIDYFYSESYLFSVVGRDSFIDYFYLKKLLNVKLKAC